MTTSRLLALLSALVGVLSIEAATEASAQTIPGIPGLPAIPGFPGQEKARFKVVVEGTASSYVEAAGSTAPGTCNVTAKAIAIDEEVTYGRGKGVTMEFVRFGLGKHKVVGLQRSGRLGDASFAVQGTISRAVGKDGLVTRAPSDPQLEATCPTATEVPASRPTCNATFPLSTDLKFVYGATAGRLKLVPLSREILAGSSPVEGCPQSDIVGSLSGLVERPWPLGLPLPSEPLSTRTVFGKRKHFKVVFHAVRPAMVTPLGAVLIGTQNRYSAQDAIVRFTRVH
jgi:hypothetical protein